MVADTQATAVQLIRIEGLSKSYRTRSGHRTEALRSITFSVNQGEFVSIVGPSGCGKTTLLKILAGIVQPSSGSIFVSDQPLRGPRRDVGMVFQQPVLLPWRTVLDNVLLPVQVLGLDRKQYSAKANELLSMVGLVGFGNRYPHELSGGMQQRVAICRALIHDPLLLLMDEPFGALDALTRERMNLELLRIWDLSKKTILLVTHSISEAVFLSDRVVVLSERPGQILDILSIGLPRPRSLEVISTPEFGRYATHIRALLNGRSPLE